MATVAIGKDDKLPTGLNVEQFLEWAKGRRGRFELHDGAVVAMAPERVGNVAVKGNVYRALGDAIARAKVQCSALPDGAAVHVSEKKWYEPDALVYCGPQAPADSLHIADPVIVVEVSSPSTAHVDEGQKLIGYFSIASVHHYLIVDPEGLPVVHHQLQSDGTILTRIVASGTIRLDPPGIEVDVARFFS